MQLDGTPGVPARPVFVDSSGRRGRLVRRVFWVLGALMAAYVGVVILALAAPPGLSRLAVPGLGPMLPGPAAAPLRTRTGDSGTPARVLASASPQPTSSPAGASFGPTPTASSGAAASNASATPRPGAASPSPSRSPGPAASTGPPSPAPRATRTPPGQASVGPSPRSSARPTPKSSHARGSSAAPSPTP